MERTNTICIVLSSPPDTMAAAINVRMAILANTTQTTHKFQQAWPNDHHCCHCITNRPIDSSIFESLRWAFYSSAAWLLAVICCMNKVWIHPWVRWYRSYFNTVHSQDDQCQSITFSSWSAVKNGTKNHCHREIDWLAPMSSTYSPIRPAAITVSI